jgi:hypothetical protein
MELDQAIETLVKAKIAAAQVANDKLKKEHDWLFDNIDNLLEFVEHERTSCDDEHPINGSDDPEHSRCSRCQLLKIKQYGYNEGWTVNFSLGYRTIQIINPDQLRQQIQNL